MTTCNPTPLPTLLKTDSTTTTLPLHYLVDHHTTTLLLGVVFVSLPLELSW